MLTNAAVQRWQAPDFPSVVAGLGSYDPAPIMLYPMTPKGRYQCLYLYSHSAAACAVNDFGPESPESQQERCSHPHLTWPNYRFLMMAFSSLWRQ